MTAPQSNRLLEALPPESRRKIIAASRHRKLPLLTTLGEPEARVRHVYFMTSSLASTVIESAEGGTAEVSLIGREGLAGAFDLLGPATAPARTSSR